MADQKIQLLEKKLKEQQKTISGLLSELDKYKSIVHGSPGPKSNLTPPQNRTRGLGISAEPQTLKGLDDFKKENLKIFPKSVSTKEFLAKAIQNNEFMKKLATSVIQDLISIMYPVHFKINSTVIKEGDVGSTVYVIEEGELEATKDGMRLSVMSKGKVFGELAVLYNCTRTASVKALVDCKLWAIGRDAYQNVTIRTQMITNKKKLDLVKRVSKYKKENETVLQNIAEMLEELNYEYEKIIINEHDIIDSLFIVAEGKVAELLDNKIVQIYNEGDFFGCKDHTTKIASCSVFLSHSQQGCTLYMLDNETFTQYKNELKLSAVLLDDQSHVTVSTTLNLEPLDIKGVGDLEIISTIGVGGFGRVELVQPKHDKSRSYAMKKMKKHHIVETRQQEHILNERNIMIETKSEFIVRLFKTFRDSKHLYMLMEVCLGGELWTLLRDKVTFSETCTKFYIGCVIEAFCYLHQRNIVYRDLKPENLLLDKNGYLKLVDFGFSKKLSLGKKTWTFCGTPEYVAPEIILNRGHDTSCDLWSLGILVFELLTGNPPFSGAEPMRTYNLILKGLQFVNFPPLIPKHAQSFIKKLCRDNPVDRLGHGSMNLKEVKKHKWLNNFNWEALKNRELKAPYILPIKSPSDMSNFDSFPPEENSDPPDDLSGWDKDF